MTVARATHARVINAGPEAWVFEEHAARMAKALGTDASEEPARYNFVLGWPADQPLPAGSFISPKALRCTADKRLQAAAFEEHGVPIPETHVLSTLDDVARFLDAHRGSCWVLKWPVGAGATGHRMLRSVDEIPRLWEPPFLLQRFVEMDEPEVYRLYVVGADAVGWNVRRFPEGVAPSPFVAHAKGARYVDVGLPPAEVVEAGLLAMRAVGLEGGFGAVDFIPDRGRWLVLEVNTDGPYQHVDRDFEGADRLDQQISTCFWAWARESP